MLIGTIQVAALPIRKTAEALTARFPGSPIEAWLYFAGFDTERLKTAQEPRSAQAR